MGRRETPITYGKRMLLLTVCYDLGAVDNSLSASLTFPLIHCVMVCLPCRNLCVCVCGFFFVFTHI